jgi:hypothetical protein
VGQQKQGKFSKQQRDGKRDNKGRDQYIKNARRNKKTWSE